MSSPRPWILPLLVAACALSASAQQDPVVLSVDGDGRPIRPPTALQESSRAERPPTPDELDPGGRPAAPTHRSVLLELPRYTWATEGEYDLVGQVSLRRLPPGSVQLRYAGLKGHVMDRFVNRFRSEWRKEIQNRYDEGVLTDEEYSRAIGVAYQTIHDHEAGGRWWERAWWDSLPASKGGAPDEPVVFTEGQRVTILSVGPLALHNDLRVRVRDFAVFGVDVDDGPVCRDLTDRGPRNACDGAILDRHLQLEDPGEALDELPPPRPRREHPGELRLRGDRAALEMILQTHHEELWGDLSWRFKLRPSSRLKLKGLELDGKLRMTGELEIYAGVEQLLNVECQVDYKLETREVVTSVQVVLTSW